MVQARKFKYDVIGLTETRRTHPLNAVYDTGEELFSGTCDSTGVDGVGVLVNTRSAFLLHVFLSLSLMHQHQSTKKKKKSKLSIWI
ncbi:hypothetical protein RB195_022130 [Necator americanus]|uniref:Uncharacterized protein n=1 Tax=Necator americanus TaxID=51031 RepID=A0ABR1EE06_NECAM